MIEDDFKNQKSGAWHVGYEYAKLIEWQSNTYYGSDAITNPYEKNTNEHTEWSLGFYYYFKHCSAGS